MSYYFLPEPHIPSSSISLCAVGEQYQAIRNWLEKEGVSVISIPASNDISSPVSCHPDLRLGILGSSAILVSMEDSAISTILLNYGFQVEKISKLTPTYPKEASLDFCVLKNLLFYNKKAHVLNYSQFVGNFLSSISVAQGYIKCNMAIVNRNAFITSDESIAQAGLRYGFDVLKIASGSIKLPGYDTGFIGGCCGLISPNRMIFAGEPLLHPCGKEILSFLNKHHVESESACDGPLCDIGGVIPLMQCDKSLEE